MTWIFSPETPTSENSGVSEHRRGSDAEAASPGSANAEAIVVSETLTDVSGLVHRRTSKEKTA